MGFATRLVKEKADYRFGFIFLSFTTWVLVGFTQHKKYVSELHLKTEPLEMIGRRFYFRVVLDSPGLRVATVTRTPHTAVTYLRKRARAPRDTHTHTHTRINTHIHTHTYTNTQVQKTPPTLIQDVFCISVPPAVLDKAHTALCRYICLLESTSYHRTWFLSSWSPRHCARQ